MVSKATYGRLKSPLFLEPEQKCCCLAAPAILCSAFSGISSTLWFQPSSPLTLPACAPLSARLSSHCPVTPWSSTCLRPSSSLTTSHPATTNTHPCTHSKPERPASLPPVFVCGSTVLQQLQPDHFFTSCPSSCSALCSPGTVLLTRSLPSASPCPHSHELGCCYCTFVRGLTSVPVSGLTFLLCICDMAPSDHCDQHSHFAMLLVANHPELQLAPRT